jgi:large subunit ribosomal protein L22
MESKATSRFLMISPRKARLVADEIRGYIYPEAMDILKVIPRKASGLIEGVLKSARANATVMAEGIPDNKLFVKKIFIDAGPTLKRFRPRARGRAMHRLKRTSHITIVLSDE